MNSTPYLEVINRALMASQKIIKHYFRQGIAVDRKSDQSPVTIADKETELAIRDIISRSFPEHNILGEEHGSDNKSSEYCWVIDPIDGTKSFISGLPLFGTLIGLTKNNQPLLGVIDMPILNERWVAVAGDKTYLNDKICKVSQTTLLKDAILYSTEPNMFVGKDATKYSQLAATVAMRRFGGDCYNYGLLASGYIDLVVEADLKYHDIMSLIPIIESAGGVMTDWQGNVANADFDGRIIAAATPELHQQAMVLLA